MKYDLKKYGLLYTIGSFIGYLIETIFCFLKYQRYIIKKGMIIGPFKPLYGIGILLIYFCYNFLKKKNKIQVFFIGTILGTMYEYLASLFETYILHTNTWDYSKFDLNINGRIYLPYSILWGILIVILIFYIFPLFEKLYNKMLENKICKYACLCLSIFMIFNFLLTTTVFLRYGLRNNNIKPYTYIGEVIDHKFNNEYMKENFPRLRPAK